MHIPHGSEAAKSAPADVAVGFVMVDHPLERLDGIAKRERAEIVLVVDDEPLVLMSVVDYLVSEGFTVLEAGNADRAIVILETHPGIAAIFTDVQMPGTMNGLGLVGHVHERWPEIRVVVTSGNCLFGVGDLGHGDCFIRKPYQPGDVARALRPH
jgi:two-component system, response regulator PdtaR